MAEAHPLTQRFLQQQPEAAAAVLEDLAPATVGPYLGSVPAELAAAVLDAMTPFHAARCLPRMPVGSAAACLDAMSLMAAAAALRRARRATREALLARLPGRRAANLRTLLGYPASTVGAWTEVGAPALPVAIAAAEAWRRLRAEAESLDRFVDLVTRDGRLSGRVHTVELLRADPSASVDTLAREMSALPARTGLAAALDHPGWADGDPLPVISREGRYLGVVRLATLSRAARGATPRVRWETTSTGFVTELIEAYSEITARLLEACVAFPGRRQRP